MDVTNYISLAIAAGVFYHFLALHSCRVGRSNLLNTWRLASAVIGVFFLKCTKDAASRSYGRGGGEI